MGSFPSIDVWKPCFLVATPDLGYVAPDMEAVLVERRRRNAHDALKRFLDAHHLALACPCQEVPTIPTPYSSPCIMPIILRNLGTYSAQHELQGPAKAWPAMMEWLALLSTKNFFAQVSIHQQHVTVHLASAEISQAPLD